MITKCLYSWLSCHIVFTFILWNDKEEEFVDLYREKQGSISLNLRHLRVTASSRDRQYEEKATHRRLNNIVCDIMYIVLAQTSDIEIGKANLHWLLVKNNVI